MDFGSLKRDPEYIQSILEYVDNQLVTNRELTVYFVGRLLEGKLGYVDEHINVIGTCCFVSDGKYAIDKHIAIVTFSPDTTNIITIQGERYYALGFDPGSVVMPSLDLLKDDTMAYNVYNEYCLKGKSPEYFSYVDDLTIFDNVQETSGANLGASPPLLSLLSCNRARVPGDINSYARELLKTQEDLYTLPVKMIPGKSVAYGPTNTTARSVGSYLRTQGQIGAIVNKSDVLEPVEEILRS